MAGVVVVGSMNIDHVVSVDRHPQPGETVRGTGYFRGLGGKGLNQAVAAAREGAAVAMVGAVGTDREGDEILTALDAEGIDRRWVRRVDGATGRAHIVVDAAGANSIVVVPGANASATCPPAATEDASVVLAQLEVPMAAVAEAFARARAAGALTILNPAPSMAIPALVLASCSVLVPNEFELDGLDTSAFGGTLVVTRGERGADIREDRGDVRTVPAVEVDVVDTTAAGDAFCGSLAAALAAGSSLAAAVERAVAAGALACTGAGALPSLPRRSAVDGVLRAGRG